MKPETNNEMDLLLRRLGRNAESHKDGDHLDADELSSYAENALPAAARARYTDHLAECASCRKLVAQLSSSAGVVSLAETAKVSEPSALRKFLASLFSPMVLRYAVPALGLIVVAAIGFTVLRQNQSRDSVAQLTQQEVKMPDVPSEPVQSPLPGLIDDREKTESTGATADTRGLRSSETQPAPPPNASVGRVVGAVDQAAPVTKPEEQPAANAAAAPPPQPTPATATDEIKKREEPEAAKLEAAGRAVNEVRREKAAESPKRDDRTHGYMVAESPAPTAAARKAQGAGSVAILQRDGVEDKKDAETRSVAGRRFRRENGMWIDTAYAAPRSTVSLSRGSEQYRALVADEPGIRTIAEELDGEIIVVWKGRAYRIR